MKRIFHFPFLSFLIYLAVAGCGGSNTGPVQGPHTVAAVEFYQLTGTSNTNASLNFSLNGALTWFNDSTISGVLHISNSSCFPFNTDIQATGKLLNVESDQDLTLTLPSGQMLSFTLQRPGDFFTGTYTITGTGCATQDQGMAGGNFTNVGGIYIGSLNSSGGTSSNINLTINLVGPDANGFFSATGTATITGGTCFSSATVDPATVLSGPNSQIVLVDSAAGKTGKTMLQGTLQGGNFGSVIFNGTYTSTEGACSDSGSANVQKG